MAKKEKLTREQKKMKHARAVSGNGAKADPYYPTDYRIGQRNPKKEEKPMVVTAPPMTTKEWVGTLIILMIPIVNIIALIAWSNKKNEKINPNKRTFARAQWILVLITALLEIVVIVALVLISILLFPFPATPAEATDMLEEAGYYVDVYDGDEAQSLLPDNNLDAYLVAYDDGEVVVEMLFFVSEDDAMEYYEELSERIEDDEEKVYGMYKNVVYFGTIEGTDAINANSMF